MFEVERDRDEVVVTSNYGFDIVHENGVGTLVMTIKEARRLVEALMDHTMTVDFFAEGEDG